MKDANHHSTTKDLGGAAPYPPELTKEQRFERTKRRSEMSIPRNQRRQLAIAFHAGRRGGAEANPFVIGGDVTWAAVETPFVAAWEAGRHRRQGDRLLAMVMLAGAVILMDTVVRCGRHIDFH